MEDWIVFILGFTQFLLALDSFMTGKRQRLHETMNHKRFAEMERRLDDLSSKINRCPNGSNKGVESPTGATEENSDSEG